MKNLFFIFMFVSLFSGMAMAQGIRLNAYSAYVFSDRVDSYYDPYSYYKGTINDGYQWGVGLEFMARPTKAIELKYIRRDATAPMEYYNNGVKFKNFDLGINYILLGGTNYFNPGSKVEPYAGAGLGVAILSVKNPDAGGSGDITKFAWNVKLGTNIWVTEKVGLKLQFDLLSVVQSVGGGFYFGTGGSGVGMSTYSTMYQWGLGGGLTFKMGQ